MRTSLTNIDRNGKGMGQSRQQILAATGNVRFRQKKIAFSTMELSKSASDVFVVQGEKENHIWIKMKNVKLTKNKYRLIMIPNILILLKKYNLYPAGSQPCMFYVQ